MKPAEAWKVASGSTPIFRLPLDKRAAVLGAFVGWKVWLDVDAGHYGKAPVTQYAGELVSVAEPIFGTVSLIVVLRVSARGVTYDLAISSAAIRRIQAHPPRVER